MMVSKPFLSRRLARVGWLMALLTSLTLALSACARDASQLSGAALQAQSQTEAAAAQLQTQSEGALQIDYYAPTGVAHWVAAEGGVLTRQFSSASATAAAERKRSDRDRASACMTTASSSGGTSARCSEGG